MFSAILAVVLLGADYQMPSEDPELRQPVESYPVYRYTDPTLYYGAPYGGQYPSTQFPYGYPPYLYNGYAYPSWRYGYYSSGPVYLPNGYKIHRGRR